MILIDAKRYLNDKTFEPFIRVTVDVPIEGLIDHRNILSPDDLKNVLGTEIEKILTQAMERTRNEHVTK
jgi:hypothetical protein